jgi:hypothetical protein
MSLFDFGLSMQEPDLLYVGDIDLDLGVYPNEWIIDEHFTYGCDVLVVES